MDIRACAAIAGIADLAMTGPVMADTGDFGQQVVMLVTHPMTVTRAGEDAVR